MIINSSLIMLFLFNVVSCSSSLADYTGYKLIETSSDLSESQLNLLQRLWLKQNSLDFWIPPSTLNPATVMVAPQDFLEFKEILNNNEIGFKIVSNDVQRLLMESKQGKSNQTIHSWEDYSTLEVLNEFLQEISQKYDFVGIEVIGKSFENRDIFALTINKAGPKAPNIFIDGSTHGNEWISPAVVTFLLNQLLTEDAGEVYLDNLNFYIVPIVNPDGYAFTFSNDRLWRKSRTTVYSEECPGVDLNRNFAKGFGGGATSTDPCSINFLGSEAFSEPESYTLAKFFQSIDPVPILAISYHSPFHKFFLPHMYTAEEQPDNFEEMMTMCEDAMDALNKVNNQSVICVQGSTVYEAGGTTSDFFISEGSRFAMTPELRDLEHFFLLPPEYILPSGHENWAALQVMLDQIIDLDKNNKNFA